MDEYGMRYLARERIAEMQAFRERQAALRAGAAERPDFRIRLGLALIRAGRWLLGRVPVLDEAAPASLSRARSGSR
jgi:hypothetical protein